MNYWQNVEPNDWEVFISISRKEKSRCSCHRTKTCWQLRSNVAWWGVCFIGIVSQLIFVIPRFFLGSIVQSSRNQGFLNPTETCCRMFQIGESVHHKSGPTWTNIHAPCEIQLSSSIEQDANKLEHSGPS